MVFPRDGSFLEFHFFYRICYNATWVSIEEVDCSGKCDLFHFHYFFFYLFLEVQVNFIIMITFGSIETDCVIGETVLY